MRGHRRKAFRESKAPSSAPAPQPAAALKMGRVRGQDEQDWRVLEVLLAGIPEQIGVVKISAVVPGIPLQIGIFFRDRPTRLQRTEAA
jgi:hypothetical protein